jgi:hypothetical protein
MNASPSFLHRQPFGSPSARRGVLLLVVLSMLTLFMMLGVAYVIMASRARESSRAFSRAITQERLTDRADEKYLDKALMLVLRGIDPTVSNPLTTPGNLIDRTTSQPITQSTFFFESLLDDLYGSNDRLEAFTVAPMIDHGVLCEVAIDGPTGTGTVPQSPIELAGRIITFLPEKGRITSHRILRVEEASNGYRIWIANHGDVFPRKPSIQTGGQIVMANDFPTENTRVIINGRGHGGNTSGANVVANEPWDGYDFAHNPFLAWVEPDPATPSSAIVKRFSMFDLPTSPIAANVDLDNDGLQDYCDNDGDGVLDGQFFRPGFAPIPVDGGNVLQVDLSCLIVDLDGRLNLNAHGTLAALLYPEQNPGWPGGGQGAGGPQGGGSQWGKMPLGSGYGPAEINPRVVFDELMNSRNFASSDDPWLSVLCGGDPQSQYKCLRPPADLLKPDQGCRTIPPGFASLEGRYGGKARQDMIDPDVGQPMTDYDQTFEALPGFEGIDDPLSVFNQQQFTGSTRPIDLHGRLKLSATASSTAGTKPAGVVPTMQFAKPDQMLADPLEDDLTDDPYEINLVTAVAGGRNADPRTGGDRYFTPANGQSPLPDNRFSVGELERLLRPYDADATMRAPRLFTLLGSQAEAARLLATTESWSVPSITGETAERLFGARGWFAKVADPQKLFSTTGPPNLVMPTTVPDGLVPVDLAAGLKLDLAPPLQTDAQRRSLFKDLFLTCIALLEQPGQNPSPAKAEQYAQWAANVVEFQDGDSAMTRYEYDPEPLDGWDVDGDPATDDSGATRAIVWGGERPDVIITQTLAWTNSGQPNEGELYVMLHRPLKSTLAVAGGQATPAEPIDQNLQGQQPDQIDLGRVQGDDPVWRLRLGSGQGAKIVRFDPLPNPPDQNDLGSQNPPQVVNEFGPHQWLCVRPSGASSEGVTVPSAPEVESFPVESGSLQVDAGTDEVRLERLADPARPYEADEAKPDYNPYIVVDVADIIVIDRVALPGAPAPAPHHVCTRSGWAQQFPPETVPANSAPEMTAEWDGNPEWIVWPDRPLVGITELLFVPGFAQGSYRPLPADDPDAAGLFANYLPPAQVTYLPDLRLLEVVRVPSRFAGTRLSFATPADAAARSSLESIGVYESLRSTNQIDLAREPGLVNVNTIASDAIWRGVVQGGLGGVGQKPKVRDRSTADLAATPAETVADVLAIEGGNPGNPPYEDDAADIPDVDRNPWHRLHTATRLSNTATNRSHVFGIWLTVRTVEKVGGPNGQPDLDTVKYSRMFVIYDRSKPVAYEPGRDHNAADGILLKRVLP